MRTYQIPMCGTIPLYIMKRGREIFDSRGAYYCIFYTKTAYLNLKSKLHERQIVAVTSSFVQPGEEIATDASLVPEER